MKESILNRVGIYRWQAQLCRNLASREREPKHKAELVDLADRWSNLARSLEQSTNATGESFGGELGNTPSPFKNN